MPDREKIIDGLAHCLPETKEDAMMGCESCSYFDECRDKYIPVSLLIELVKDFRKLLEEQNEREKGICKAVCDFIRSGISTDTKADQDYVCHEIQNRFIHFERSVK